MLVCLLPKNERTASKKVAGHRTTEETWTRNDKECVASFPRIPFLSTISNTTLDHHYPPPLRVSDTLIHTMDTRQHSYYSGTALFSQNTPLSLSPDLDCLTFPSASSLPLIAQDNYPTPPHQASQSPLSTMSLSSAPVGASTTQYAQHTSILDVSAWSGAEFEAICASLSEDQLIKTNNLAYRILNNKLMATQAALNGSRYVLVCHLLLLSD
jgi:hypothetical protein